MEVQIAAKRAAEHSALLLDVLRFNTEKPIALFRNIIYITATARRFTQCACVPNTEKEMPVNEIGYVSLVLLLKGIS